MCGAHFLAIRRMSEPLSLKEQGLMGTDYLDMNELFAVPRMVYIQSNISVKKIVLLHTGA
jgi:hypothetical protein